MPRQNRGIDGLTGGSCKIRKRGCSSSSSSSSVLQNYRLKRAVLVGKRGGSSTPVPRWKMNAGSPSSMASISESSQCQPLHIGGKCLQASVSARKLATALWEMNEVPSPQVIEDLQDKRSKKEKRGRDRIAGSVQSGSLPPRLSDPSHSPVSETVDRSRYGSHRRIIPLVSQKCRCNEHNFRASELLSNTSLMETETRSQGLTPTSSVLGTKSHLKDLSNGLTTSKELLKVLYHIWGAEEQHSSSMSLVSALHVELDKARVLVDQLIQERRSDCNEINFLKKRFVEEKSSWKSKEQGRIKAAVNSIIEELESEKKLRRRAERLNKKLGIELAKMKASLLKETKELESERRSREIIEQVCDELVRGIGEDKAEVEKLKRESAKVREELEEEREMLQLADLWREERVHMKLSEAKFQFEEKNAAVDQLRNELEAFLTSKRTKETRSGHKDTAWKLEDEDQRQLVHPSKSCITTDLNVDGSESGGEVEDGEEGGDEDEVDSADSDLHSIELNMDNNNKSYSWSYATASAQEEAKLALVEEKSKGKGRSSNGEKDSRNKFYLDDEGMLEGIKWNPNNKSFQHLGGELDQRRLFESKNLVDKHARKLDQDVERYMSVKGLRDHMLAESKIALTQGLASPTRQWSRPRTSQDMGDQVCEGSKVTEMVKANRESGSRARLVGVNNNSSRGQLPIATMQ